MRSCHSGPLAAPDPSAGGRGSWSRGGKLYTGGLAGRQLFAADPLQPVEPGATAAVGAAGEADAVAAVELVVVDVVESVAVAVDLLMVGVA